MKYRRPQKQNGQGGLHRICEAIPVGLNHVIFNFSARTSSSDDVFREVLEIHRTYTQSSVPLLAVEAIYEDMMRQKLRWHKRGSHEPDYRRKVPLGYLKCIRQIVERAASGILCVHVCGR